ncbi:hypothetical protein [Streptomyces nitrosporeus]|uniref:Transmembrane protein n=1 Tax=Streptomyces nitrosporeus TaxID=28894 RepID=A0A5J6FAP0_9ACTN|nr:hypothetical protein [Streptomyces nitrosporeus]QEU73428.1 hypothetical protein CP967_16790 [Streptomyces nitrosporeus]GGZ04675.1 membrane protein [Streptomyces nitrosporeus]
MHMASAPHLLSEDRPEYERILADALRHAHERPDLAGIGEHLNTEQLRTMALAATPAITDAAGPEYEHYVRVRGELRSPSGLSEADLVLGSAGEGDRTGAGTLAVITALAPVLAGTAALIFLLVGYVLKAVSPTLAFAGTMVTAGWFFAAAAAAAMLVAAAGLLVTALRNGATALPAPDEEAGLPEDVARAREAWRHALLERGILPFLRDALADPTAGPAARAPHPSPHRLPKVGYSRPEFSGPQGGPSAGPRPTFTSPDFTGPDFGGPERLPE